MSILEAGLELRARRAYEVGRFAAAGGRAIPLVPLLAVALAGCSPPLAVLSCAGALLIVVTLLWWRGEQWSEGIWPGLGAGLFPLLLPALMETVSHGCRPGLCRWLPVVCAAGGMIGGCLLGVLAPRPRAGRLRPFVVACLVAALTGAIGCLLYGLVGLGVMAVGLAVGSAPVIVARRA
jgi:hypothetical protein